MTAVDTARDRIEGSGSTERRRRRLGRLVTLAVLIALIVGVGVVVQRTRDSSSASQSASTAPRTPSTAVASTKDITNDTSYDGTVLHATAMPILSRTAGHITAIAAEGTVVAPGQVLFAVDGSPTVLFTGDLPAWRDLSPASAPGPDITQLQKNLVALGFDPASSITVGDTYTAATAAAVVRWQQQIGVTQSGVVGLGDVLFEPTSIVMGHEQVAVGSGVSAGSAVADAQLAALTMQFTLPSDAKSVISIGQGVDVTMPDRSTAKGTITSIGTATDSSGNAITVGRGPIDQTVRGGGNSGAQAAQSTAVTDGAAIKVRVRQTIGSNVLVVPANALTARTDKDFTLGVVQPDGSTRTVSVKVGVSGGGYVQVSGDGIAPGTKVVIPSFQ